MSDFDSIARALRGPKRNLTATSAPTVTDDDSVGYELCSLWADGVAKKIYVCTDASTGAAVWVEITASDDLISGVYRALEDPADLEDLAAFLDATYRPQIGTGNTPATIYLDSGAGDDLLGDGTIGTPLATLSRAYQLHAMNPQVARTIQLTSGTYPVTGRGIHALNRLTIKGPAPTEEIRAVTVDGSSSRAAGLVLNDTVGGLAVDVYRGRTVEFVGGSLDGDYGVIYENTAGQLFVSQDTQGTFVAAGVTSIKIRTLGATITLPDGPFTFESASALAIEDVIFQQTNRELRFNDTDQVTCRRCEFYVRSIAAGRGGTGNFQTCYIANDGTTSTDNGMVYARTQGILTLQRGTVIDGVNAAAAAAHMMLTTVGICDTWGEVVFRDLGDNGIMVRATSNITTRKDSLTTDSEWRFVDCAHGIKCNPDDEGQGGEYNLPDLFGNIVTGFAVVAARGANVFLGASSAVLTPGVGGGTGTNDVSATDGATLVAQHTDLTYIEGGAPVAAGFETADPANSSTPFQWGAGSVSGTTTDRFLYPSYGDGLAQTVPIQIRAPFPGTLKNMRVRHNGPNGNGNDIVYTFRVNNTPSALTATLASTGSDAADLINSVAVAAGDLLDIIITKALSVGAAPNDVTVTAELEA